MPLPTSPSSSPRLLRSNSSEWHAVVQQRNVRSSLLLLLVLSTVFVFSVLYSSHGFGATTADQALTQRQSTDHGAIDRFVPGHQEADEPRVVPAENNEAPEPSLPSDISLPSTNTSPAPVVPASSRGGAEQTGDQSKCSFTVNCLTFTVVQSV